MPPCHLLRPIFEASDSAGSIPDSAGLGRMQDPVTEKWFIHSPDVWWIVLMHYPYPKPPMIHLWCNIHPSLTNAPIVRQCALECGCHSVQAKGKSQFQICFPDVLLITDGLLRKRNISLLPVTCCSSTDVEDRDIGTSGGCQFNLFFGTHRYYDIYRSINDIYIYI